MWSNLHKVLENNRKSMNEGGIKLETGLELNRGSDCLVDKVDGNEAKTHEVEFTIPPHVLGHDFDNREDDSSSLGKRLQKPRPGVKIPYRNLTSTIVTSDEIAQEILERSLKNYNYSSIGSDDILFPVNNNPINDQKPLSSQIFPQRNSTAIPNKSLQGSDNSPIKDTEELLSILQGNENKDKRSKDSFRSQLEQRTPVMSSSYKMIKMYPELERELALKQLSEFTPQRKKKESKPSETPKEKNPSIKSKKAVEFVAQKPLTRKNVDANKIKIKVGKPMKNKPIGKRKNIAEPVENPKKKKVSSRTNGNCRNVDDEIMNSSTTSDVESCTIQDGFLPIVPPLKDDRCIRKFVNKRKLTKSDSNSNASVHVNGTNKSNENGDCDSDASNSIPKNKKTSPSKKSEGSNSVVDSIDPTNLPSKSPSDSAAGAGKKKTRAMREIERLLGDEGAINMIYSVEQKRTPGNEPSRRGILPSTRRMKKDLILKTRLVKSAVLRLSNSPSQALAKTALRARRDSSTPSTSTSDAKCSKESPTLDSSKPHQSSVADSSVNSPFISPSKLSVPAEASRIIRRHSSSSSYSSRSNSPRRLSVDTEKTLISSSPLSTPGKLTSESESYSPKKLILNQSTSSERHSEPEVSKIPPFFNNNTLLKLSPNPQPVNSLRTARLSSIRQNKLLKREEIKEILRRASDKRPDDTPLVFKRDIHDKLNAEISRTIMKNMIAAKLDKAKRRLDESEIESYIKSVSNFDNRSSTSPALSPASSQTSTSISKPEGTSFPAPLSPTPTSYSNLVKSITSESQKKRENESEKHRSSNRQITGGSHSYKEISLRRYDHLVQIILTPISTKMKNSFNSQVFKEMSSVLSCLRKDESCRVVLMTSTGSAFCYGIDITALMQPTPEKRKSAAVEMLLSMKEFVKSLATFNKPLIAGVHGAAVGLGVTMLPFFDMVFASDKATFHTPYARLGQVPEGAATLTLPQMLGNAVTSELLFGCRKLTASEALHFGLVTRILWPDRFQEELIPLIRGIATQSSQSMEATKALLRHSLCTKLDPALLSESQLLLQHWTSNECQECFKQYLEEETPTMQK